MYLKSYRKLSLLTFVLIFLACSAKNEDSLTLDKLGKDYSTLTKNYEEVIRQNPKDLSLRIKLALFYYNFRDYQKAKALLEGVDSLKAKEFLIKTLIKLGEDDQAIAAVEQLDTLPQDPEFLYLYGRVLEGKNLFPKAITVYNKVDSPYKDKAQERIRLIKTNQAADKIPGLISKLSQEASNFVSGLAGEANVVLLADETIEVTPQNTSVSTIHVIQKVLQERGKESAEVDIGYDSTYERVELEFARTITSDGKVISAGRENIRDVSRYLNYPLYSNSRAFIISMPSVDVGAFIEYKMKIYSSKLVDEDNFSFIYRLRESCPIFKAKFDLILPKDREVNFKFFNQNYASDVDLTPVLKEDIPDKKVYTLAFDQIESIIPEYSMPPEALVNPAILFSSFSSWDQIYKWWTSLYIDKVKPADEIKALVKELTKGIKDDLAKAKKIYEYVAKNIRYVAIEYGDGGYEPHYAQDVLLNRYGDCKDQAILLVSMLKAAGLSAHPVLVPTRGTYPVEKSFPSINFNHAIAVLKYQDQLIFMDPTSEATPFKEIPLSDQNRPVMVFFDHDWAIVNTEQSDKNKITYNMEIKIDDQENADITRIVLPQGFFSSSYRLYLKYTHPAIIEEDIRKKMTSISPFSKLLNYSIENQDDFDREPMLTYNFITEKFINPAKNLRVIPALDQINLDYNLIGKDRRDYPIDFEGLYVKEAKVRINLPANLKVKYLPLSQILDNPWFKINTSYQAGDGFIDFYQSFTVKKRFVDTKDYLAFKKHLKEAIYYLREEVILEKVDEQKNKD